MEELKRKDIASKNSLFGSFLAKLIFLLSDEGLSRLMFSKNEIKRCKNLRLWVHKINNLDDRNFADVFIQPGKINSYYKDFDPIVPTDCSSFLKAFLLLFLLDTFEVPFS